jgi:hypothetical protein
MTRSAPAGILKRETGLFRATQAASTAHGSRSGMGEMMFKKALRLARMGVARRDRLHFSWPQRVSAWPARRPQPTS